MENKMLKLLKFMNKQMEKEDEPEFDNLGKKTRLKIFKEFSESGLEYDDDGDKEGFYDSYTDGIVEIVFFTRGSERDNKSAPDDMWIVDCSNRGDLILDEAISMYI